MHKFIIIQSCVIVVTVSYKLKTQYVIAQTTAMK